MEYAEQRELAAKIAGALGWFLEPAEEHRASSTLTAPGEEGYSLWLRWEKERISVHPHYPKDRHGRESFPPSYDPQATTISLSSTRPPEVMAREIERRFMPDYIKAFTVQAQRVKQQDDFAARTVKTAETLKALCGGRDYGRQHDDSGWTLNFPDSHLYTVSAHGASVRFEPFSVPVDVAVRIIEACHKKPEEQEGD